MSLLIKSRFLRFLSSFKGSNVSKSLILLPDRVNVVSLGDVCRRFRPFEILLSDNSNWGKNKKKIFLLFRRLIFYLIKNPWLLTFLRFGSLGNPLRLVRPTFIKLRDSRLTNSSVRPTMLVLRQLSKFNSLIWN